MKIIGLLSCGRSGQDLFLSLLDGHNQILQFPGYVIFNKELSNIFSLKSKRDIAEKFSKLYPHFFDSKINKIERHHQLGIKKNQYFTVDIKKFTYNFEKNSSVKSNSSKLKVLIELNKSYYRASNKSLKDIKIFMIQFHLFHNLSNYLKIFSNKENMTIILTLRDVLASLGSTCKKWLRYEPNALDAHTLYLNIIGHLKQIYRLKKLNKKIYIIQLEKLHTENTRVMKDFCRIFKMKYKKSLKDSTFFGLKWWGDKTSLKYLNGVNPKFKNKFYSNFFFKKDIYFIEKKIINLLRFYNYPIRSVSKNYKILDIIPYKFEFLIWADGVKKINVKKILKIPLFWVMRVLNLYTDSNYENFDFPYSIGSTKNKIHKFKK
jgi:hypothetical protein